MLTFFLSIFLLVQSVSFYPYSTDALELGIDSISALAEIEFKKFVNFVCKDKKKLFKFLLMLRVNPAVQAMLDLICFAEHTGSFSSKPDFNKYKILFGGTVFDSFSYHPHIRNVRITPHGYVLKSTAAGAYQFLIDTWEESKESFKPVFLLKKKDKLKNLQFLCEQIYGEKHRVWYLDEQKIIEAEFNPLMQDLGAILLLIKKDSLFWLLQGNFPLALKKISSTWSSIPCNEKSMYSNKGQRAPYSVTELQRIFQSYLQFYNQKVFDYHIINKICD